MDEQLRRLRAEAQRLAQGKPRSQVRYPDTFRRALSRWPDGASGRAGP